MSKKNLLLFIVVILSVAGIIYLQSRPDSPNKSVNGGDGNGDNSQQDKNDTPKGFDTSMHSVDEPGSIWWVVNKTRPLPDGYVPADLYVPNVKLRLNPSAEQMQYRRIASNELESMFKAASTEGVNLVFGSGYRSEAYQKQLYDGYVASNGQAYADRTSARPGTSEHQTGLAFDATASNGACHLEKCFADTPEGKWIAANAYKFGFIIRYPDGKESITGYDYEPWHMRYVGTELSSEMRAKNILTLEEFFGLPAAPDYK